MQNEMSFKFEIIIQNEFGSAEARTVDPLNKSYHANR